MNLGTNSFEGSESHSRISVIVIMTNKYSLLITNTDLSPMLAWLKFAEV